MKTGVKAQMCDLMSLVAQKRILRPLVQHPFSRGVLGENEALQKLIVRVTILNYPPDEP